jgi:cytoskeletal protein RodZ
MKDIGEKLKETRKKTGISIEEAAEDLNYKVSQLEDIESGKYKNFKDKFVLKTLVSDYSKYLGLNTEEIIDEFNDFVFESTSKIPIDEIAKANKNKIKDTDDKIASPYTAIEEPKKVPLIIIVSLIILLVVFIAIFIYNVFFKETGNTSFDVVTIIGRNLL